MGPASAPDTAQVAGSPGQPFIIHVSVCQQAPGPEGPRFARKDKAWTPDSSSFALHLSFPEEHDGLLFLAERGRQDCPLLKGRPAVSRITGLELRLFLGATCSLL